MVEHDHVTPHPFVMSSHLMHVHVMSFVPCVILIHTCYLALPVACDFIDGPKSGILLVSKVRKLATTTLVTTTITNNTNPLQFPLLEEKDMVIALNMEPTTNKNAFMKLISKYGPGDALIF